MTSIEPVLLGVDVGGTTTAAGLVTRDGRVLSAVETSTHRDGPGTACDLLLALGPSGPGGAIAGLWGARTLAFSFAGLVIGGVVASLPFMVQPLRNAFAAIETEVLEVSDTLGASHIQRFWRIVLPLARPGYIVGAIMSFAHTMGEFGVVLMIGGNIPGQTKVLSIAIYDFVERLEWDKAHVLAGGMVVFGFCVIFGTLVAGRVRDRG